MFGVRDEREPELLVPLQQRHAHDDDRPADADTRAEDRADNRYRCLWKADECPDYTEHNPRSGPNQDRA